MITLIPDNEDLLKSVSSLRVDLEFPSHPSSNIQAIATRWLEPGLLIGSSGFSMKQSLVEDPHVTLLPCGYSIPDGFCIMLIATEKVLQ